VPGGTWVFRIQGGRWRVMATGGLDARGGFSWVWLPSWLLGRKMLLAQGFPVTPARDGVWLHTSQTPNPGRPVHNEGAWVAWENLKDLERRGHHLVYQGQPQGAPGDAILLDQVWRSLQALARVNPEQREVALEAWVAKAFDPVPVRRSLRRLFYLVAELRLGLTFYAIWLVVLLPILLAFRGGQYTWPFILAVTLYFQFYLGWLASRAHSRLLPGTREDRFSWSISCFMSPPSLFRSCEELAAKVTVDVHPATLALALMGLKETSSEGLLDPVVRDLQHPCEPIAAEDQGDILSADQEHRARLVAYLRQLLGQDIEDLEFKEDAWCPRCGERFIDTSEVCSECGVTLRRADGAK